ncbi:MAG: hypothetical protein RMY28_016965 [Nostoc sp. ChiSLP01]|nr:hypothetical protein [Nostoc sp. CmiSLP01]MDZ8282499.1 hypothetical protein [Nostoc sp. ChiSLP01]
MPPDLLNAITSNAGTGFSNASDFAIASLRALSSAVIAYDATGQLFYNAIPSYC